MYSRMGHITRRELFKSEVLGSSIRIVCLWEMCCFLVMNIPLVQKLPEFLEILIPQDHPEKEFSQ